ncbi:MAG: glycoside hydrolase family 17 [Alphaproteobacteria bacterium]|nr:glycoside hydrolase family 17 [Alphaproteobacteria bacterium]
MEIVDAPAGRLECLSYAPTTDTASPLTATDGVYVVPDGLIAADMVALAHFTECVRTYSMLGTQGDVLPLAAAAGLQVMIGIWIGADDTRNEREIAAALARAQAHPQAVRAIVVGNEVLLRREMTGERLARIVRSVKARTHLPVTYADIYEFWRRNPALADAVDFVTIHVLPYWDDPSPVDIDHVQEHVRGIVARARDTFPGKAIRIGEIGWPSAGRTRAGAVPSRVNEARFVREFVAQAATIRLPYNLIEAVDQPWKRAPEGTVGGYWGLLDKSRQLKFPLSGPVREWPEWRLAAAFTAVLSAVVLVLVGWRVRPRAGWRWAALAVALPAAGATLWSLASYLGALAAGWTGTLWTILLLGLASGGGALLVWQLAGGRLPRPAGLVAVLACLRNRHRPDSAILLGALHWAVILPAAILAVSLAVDGRHRDFLQLAFWLPAVAFALLAWQRRGEAAGDARPEEGWTALLLVAAAPFTVDALVNREALVWAAVCVLLALPWLPHARAVAAGFLSRRPRSALPRET